MFNKKAKILLVEDDLPTIEIYEEVFRKAGFEIETVKNGSGARNKLREFREPKVREGKEEKPDLILLDLLIPGLENGTSLLKEIKEDAQTKDIPLFVLTNYPDLKLGKKLLSQGVDKFLLKTDYTPRQLVQMVKEFLQGLDPSFL